MSKYERYITLQPPYTLDKWKDGAAQIRSEKEFQELVNYIPGDGNIVTREGITLIAYTPQQTHDITYPFPESGSSPTPGIITNGTAELCRCRMVLDFERGNDYIGWNSMLYATELNPVFTAMKCPTYIDAETGTTGQATCVGIGAATSKAGSYSLCINSAPASNPYASSPARSYGLYTRASDPPPTWLYTGTAPLTTMLWTYWVKPIVKNITAYHIYIEYAAAPLYAMEYRFSNADYQVYFTNSAGSAYPSLVVNALTGVNQWYFCAGWMDFTKKNHGIYIYDDVLKTEKYCANHSVGINNTHHFPTNESSSMLTIGGGRHAEAGGFRLDDSERLRGNLDYMTYWDIIPTDATGTSVVTLVRLIKNLHAAP